MAHAWKACWVHALTSSNLVSSARGGSGTKPGALFFNQNSLVATIPTKFLFYNRQTLQPFKGLSCYAVAGGINANILFPIETLLITALTWDQHGNEASSFNPNRAKMPAQADKKITAKHENKVYGYI